MGRRDDGNNRETCMVFERWRRKRQQIEVGAEAAEEQVAKTIEKALRGGKEGVSKDCLDRYTGRTAQGQLPDGNVDRSGSSDGSGQLRRGKHEPVIPAVRDACDPSITGFEKRYWEEED